MEYIQIKNWTKYQHYKHRSPPWIKLYSSLLNDYEYLKLPLSARGILTGLWILASQNSGNIPAEMSYLCMKLGITDTRTLQRNINKLEELGFILLASCKQSASPETETEERREEKKIKITSSMTPEERKKASQMNVLISKTADALGLHSGPRTALEN